MKKIALYGLSAETEKAITKYKEYDIVGLLDGFKTEGELFGKPVISIDEAIARNIESIIVVARPGSCKAIAKKIYHKCIENGITLFDVRGKDLLNDTRHIYNLEQMSAVIEKCVQKGTLDESSKIRITMFETRLRKISLSDCVSPVIIQDAYDIGYLFCGPIITDFVLWFSNKIEQEKIANVWFGARDGYLIHKLYQILYPGRGTYFLTSRIAAIRAGAQSKADLAYVDSMKFSGTLKDNLKERFGITAEEISGDELMDNEGILTYSNVILNRSKVLRANYRAYIKNLELGSGNVAFFDFVAKGTTQYFVQKLISNHDLKGFYFQQIEPDSMQNANLSIESFYTLLELSASVILDNYYILETILTSPDPLVIEFLEDGTPVYAPETRTQKDVQCSMRIQDGIVDYFKEYLSKCCAEKRKINKKLDEEFLKLIHNVEIKDNDFLGLIVEDPFFNRMTDITDVL